MRTQKVSLYNTNWDSCSLLLSVALHPILVSVHRIGCSFINYPNHAHYQTVCRLFKQINRRNSTGKSTAGESVKLIHAAKIFLFLTRHPCCVTSILSHSISISRVYFSIYSRSTNLSFHLIAGMSSKRHVLKIICSKYNLFTVFVYIYWNYCTSCNHKDFAWRCLKTREKKRAAQQGEKQTWIRTKMYIQIS